MSLLNDVLNKLEANKANGTRPRHNDFLEHAPPSFQTKNRVKIFTLALIFSICSCSILVITWVKLSKTSRLQPTPRRIIHPQHQHSNSDLSNPKTLLNSTPTTPTTSTPPPKKTTLSSLNLPYPTLSPSLSQVTPSLTNALEGLYLDTLEALQNENMQAVQRLLHQNTKIYTFFEPEDYYNLSLLYSKNNNPLKSIESLKAGLIKFPNNFILLTEQARKLGQQGHYIKVISLLAPHSPVLADHPSFYGMLADAYLHLNKWNEANIIYQQLAKAFPNETAWWLGLALSYQYLHHQPLAKDAFNRAIETGNLSPLALAFVNNELQGA